MLHWQTKVMKFKLNLNNNNIAKRCPIDVQSVCLPSNNK